MCPSADGSPWREVNTDGTDRLMSYQGCGCAGGEVAMMQSELVPRDDQPLVNARRTQKVYADVLGRNYKTEVLNWDGAVYTSTLQTFNGRDQVVKTTQYPGAVGTAGYQDVVMTYDGHGRMKTRHYPIEDALAHLGQIALLRRLSEAPVRGENYCVAEISTGKTGAEQSAPRKEFD